MCMYSRILCEQEASPAARRRARRTSRTTATCQTPIDSRLTAGTNLCANALVATSLRVAVRDVSCATTSSALGVRRSRYQCGVEWLPLAALWGAPRPLAALWGAPQPLPVWSGVAAHLFLCMKSKKGKLPLVQGGVVWGQKSFWNTRLLLLRRCSVHRRV